MASGSELAFFEEHEEFNAVVARLVALEDVAASDGEAKGLVAKAASMLYKYQEQAQLLDRHMEEMVKPLMERCRDGLAEVRTARVAEQAKQGGAVFTFQLLDAPVLHRVLELVYVVCKTRGWKRVVSFFPHAAADLEPCVAALLSVDAESSSTWKSRYVLLLWLSVLVLAPFPLQTMDSGDLGPAAAALAATAHGALSMAPVDGSSRPWGGGIVGTILSVCQGCLGSAGPVREAAAACVGRLLTRPDLERGVMIDFAGWGVGVIEAMCTAQARAGSGMAAQRAEAAAASGIGLTANAASAADAAGAAAGAMATSETGTASQAALPGTGVMVMVAGRPFGATADAAAAAAAEAHASKGSEGAGRALDVFAVTGLMSGLVLALKHGQRDALMAIAAPAFSRLSALTEGTEGGLLRSSAVLRRLLVKFAQRAGLTFLPPRVASWRYQRGQRSLLDNLRDAAVSSIGGDTDEAAAGGAPVTETDCATAYEAEGDHEAAEDQEGLDEETASGVEEALDVLLRGLRDQDTIVRWSAAKGVGRMAGRLPRELADEVVGAVTDLLDATEGDGAWHGGCLALAELSRRGLLLPERLPDVVPRVVAALNFDERRGATSVGSHVRDAACYVCWAFARAYTPEVVRPWVRDLASALLCVALFDREVNCRRAAAAAFQESVGRQGADNFPHGIAILTAADYFSLGNRAHAFTHVARAVAQFATYRTALVEHVAGVKLHHWDEAVRRLSARSLAVLAPLQPEWAGAVLVPRLVAQTVSADLLVRHGSTLALAEVLLALSRLPRFPCLIPPSVLVSVRGVVPRAEKVRAYRGRGGLLVREAMCRLIEAYALSGLSLGRKGALRLLQTVDECLGHSHESVQLAAAAAFEAMCAHHTSRPEAELRQRVCIRYAGLANDGENAAIRRGAALALARLPASMFGPTVEPLAVAVKAKPAKLRAAPSRGGFRGRGRGPGTGRGAAKVAVAESARHGGLALGEALRALCQATRPEALVSKRDAETRRNACEALAMLVEGLGVDVHGRGDDKDDGSHGLSQLQLETVWAALCASTADYATDTRGDVGSWVRVMAADALLRVARVLAVVPVRVSLGLPPKGTVPFVGPGGTSSPAAVAARLVRAAGPSPGDAVEHADLGACTLVRLMPAGAVAEVDFSESTGPGRYVCPYGKARVPVASLLFPGLPAADCSARPGAPGHPADTTGTMSGPSPKHTVAAAIGQDAFRLAGSAERAALVSSITQPMEAAIALGDEPIDVGVSPFALSQERAAQCIGCLLRLAVEKQDRVRAAAGRALTRLLHDAALPALSVPAPSAERLRESVMPAVNAEDESAHVALPHIVDAFQRAQTARASRMHDDTRAAEDDADAEGEGEGAVPAAASNGSAEAGAGRCRGINYAAPDEVFPRLVALLTLRQATYSRELAEGFSMSVGGMSESVVKSSAAALTTWTKAAGGAKGDRLGLEALMNNLLVLLRGRTLKSSAAAAAAAAAATAAAASMADGAAVAEDAVEERSLAEQAGSYLVESRLVVPVLRTLHAMLSKGQLGESNARRAHWTKEIVPLLRYRVMRSSDPVRVMAASEVLLGMLPLPQPVGAAALRTVLDLVAHPFPKVRRVTAERLFSSLMVFDDLFHEEASPPAPASDSDAASPGSTATNSAAGGADTGRVKVAPWLAALRELSDDGPEVAGFWGCDADTAIAILSSVAWDGDTDAVVAARDSLYEPLGLLPPSRRMGAKREDSADRWGYPDDNAIAASSGDALSSYMALVQEVGY